jgi:hypothetical protein
MSPAEYNPRTMTEDARAGLTESLRGFGLLQDIVWNERTGNIVGGHQRYSVLLAEEGPKAKVPVKVVNLDPAEEKALNIALNNPHIAGQFTPGVVDILRELQNDELAAELIPTLRLDELLPTNDTSFLDALGDGEDEDDGDPEKKKREKRDSNGGNVEFVISLSGEDNEAVFAAIRRVKKREKATGNAVDTPTAFMQIIAEWSNTVPNDD